MKFLKLAVYSISIILIVACLISAVSKPSVTVAYVRGKVKYLSLGKVSWEDLKMGTRLYSGDSIKTSSSGNVDLAFGQANEVSIRPNTHVVIKLEDPEKIELIDGEVFALVAKLPAGSTFEVRTPTAVCGARGTGFGAKGNKNSTTVSGYENDSYAKGIQKDGKPMKDETIVKQGYKTKVKKFKKPSKLKKMSKREMNKYGKWKEERKQRGTAKKKTDKKKTKKRLIKDLEQIVDKQDKLEERRDDDRIRLRDEKSGAGTGTCETDKRDYKY